MCFFITLGMIAVKLGVYSWERGKHGFHEYKCLNFDTFPELKVHDPEMISLDRFENEPDSDDIEFMRSKTRSVWKPSTRKSTSRKNSFNFNSRISRDG